MNHSCPFCTSSLPPCFNYQPVLSDDYFTHFSPKAKHCHVISRALWGHFLIDQYQDNKIQVPVIANFSYRTLYLYLIPRKVNQSACTSLEMGSWTNVSVLPMYLDNRCTNIIGEYNRDYKQKPKYSWYHNLVPCQRILDAVVDVVKLDTDSTLDPATF